MAAAVREDHFRRAALELVELHDRQTKSLRDEIQCLRLQLEKTVAAPSSEEPQELRKAAGAEQPVAVVDANDHDHEASAHSTQCGGIDMENDVSGQVSPHACMPGMPDSDELPLDLGRSTTVGGRQPQLTSERSNSGEIQPSSSGTNMGRISSRRKEMQHKAWVQRNAGLLKEAELNKKRMLERKSTQDAAQLQLAAGGQEPGADREPSKGSGVSSPIQHLDTNDVQDLMRLRIKEQSKIQAYDREVNSSGLKATLVRRCTSLQRDIFQEKEGASIQVRAKYLTHQVIASPLFEVVIAIVIMSHSICIGVETSETVTYRRNPSALGHLEIMFLTIYVVELSLRFFAEGMRTAMQNNWVRFDATMVFCGVLNFVLTALVPKGALEGFEMIMLIRILRISRLARAARLMMQFRTLWMLVQGLMHSILTLIWTLLTAMVLCYIFAILGMEIFKKCLHNPEQYDPEYAAIVQAYFGTLSDAMMTMFQFLTLDSIEPIYRPLIRHNAGLFVYFVSYVLLVPIALMNLVTAIMVESALKQANEDQEAQRAWDKQKRRTLLPKLVRLFKDLDTDGSGDLDIEELRDASDEVKTQLMAICNWGELEDIFNQLDYDSSGQVGIDEFCEGLLKAGSDKPVELYCIMRQCCDILANSREAVSILGAMSSPAGSPRLLKAAPRKMTTQSLPHFQAGV